MNLIENISFLKKIFSVKITFGVQKEWQGWGAVWWVGCEEG